MWCAVFNVGEYRRKIVDISQANHDFFRQDNPEGLRIRM